MSQTYYTILTDVGQSKLATAVASGGQINLTDFRAGDGNGSAYDPVSSQTDLVNQQFSGSINNSSVNGNVITIEAFIPPADGGWVIREAGIFDADGDLFAIAKFPEAYIATPDDGGTLDVFVRIRMIVVNPGVVTFQIDPHVVVATQQYVLDQIASLTDLATQQYVGNQIDNLEDLIDPVGIPKLFSGTVAPVKHVLAIGETLGNDDSGSVYTNANTGYSTLRLYGFLWNNFSNSILPILDSDGNPDTRGSSASADYDADKRLTIPDLRDLVAIGLGNHATAIGQKIGSKEFNLSLAHLPEINVNVSGGGGGGGANHRHRFYGVLNASANAAESGNDDYETSPPAHSYTDYTDTRGGSGSVSYDVLNQGKSQGDAVSKIQESFGVNYMYKL